MISYLQKLKGSGTFATVVLVIYAILFLPFWKPLLLGFIFACASAPMLNRLRRNFHARRATFAYMLVAAAIVTIVGLVFLISFQVYSLMSRVFENPDQMAEWTRGLESVRERAVEWMSEFPYLQRIGSEAQLEQALSRLLGQLRGVVLEWTQQFFSQGPEFLLALFIFAISYAGFLTAGARIWLALSRILDLSPEQHLRFAEFERICSVALWSLIITGGAQATLVTIGCAIAGYHSAFLIFFVTFIFSLIPVLGAGLFPTFLAIVSFAQGDSSAAVILIITALIAGTADNIIRAWLFSRAAESNPIFSLISLLGAIALMGFPGLVVAPVVEQLVMNEWGDKSEMATKTRSARRPRLHRRFFRRD